jgi:predicted nucleotidyltransferase
MRLSKNQVEIIKQVVFDIFGESEIYLFGSRVDDSKRGGDIDLFVIPKSRDGNLFEKKVKASVKLENLLELPVDLIVHYDFDLLIEKEALKGIKF